MSDSKLRSKSQIPNVGPKSHGNKLIFIIKVNEKNIKQICFPEQIIRKLFFDKNEKQTLKKKSSAPPHINQMTAP